MKTVLNWFQVAAVNSESVPARSADVAIGLDRAEVGQSMIVSNVVSGEAGSGWGDRLRELGFIEGEHVRILRRGQPGNDPLVVRVGVSTFALRRAEAACLRVIPSAEAPR